MMVRFIPFVAALVTLGVTAGAHVPSSKKATADKAELGPHGRRASSCTLYCNFIGCPKFYTPIEDAKNVECNDNLCEVSQCCDLFCNSIGCPDGSTPIDNGHNVLCDDDPCEESQCCEAFCSYFACPNGFAPVYDAENNILCPDSRCTKSLCCERVGN